MKNELIKFIEDYMVLEGKRVKDNEQKGSLDKGSYVIFDIGMVCVRDQIKTFFKLKEQGKI